MTNTCRCFFRVGRQRLGIYDDMVAPIAKHAVIRRAFAMVSSRLKSKDFSAFLSYTTYGVCQKKEPSRPGISLSSPHRRLASLCRCSTKSSTSYETCHPQGVCKSMHAVVATALPSSLTPCFSLAQPMLVKRTLALRFGVFLRLSDEVRALILLLVAAWEWH